MKKFKQKDHKEANIWGKKYFYGVFLLKYTKSINIREHQ
jgi:hypothetical protein